MKKFTLLLAVLFLFALNDVVQADYSVYDYDPAYTPYNLQAAINHGNCEAELEEFDSTYQEIRQRYIDYIDGGYTAPGMTIAQANRIAANEIKEIETAFQLNDFESENAIADCLDSTLSSSEEQAKKDREAAKEEKREEEVRMGLLTCDLEVIEDLTEEEEQRFALKLQPCVDARETVIRSAVAVCDFDFFENEMTRNERNDWFSERKNCEENPPAIGNVPVEITPISVLTPEPVVPTYVPPAPLEQVEPVTEPEPEVTTEEVSTSTPTTTEETIELTQEELDRIVEEKLNEKLEEVEPEPASQPEEKPSFFKRVTNFLFGWMF